MTSTETHAALSREPFPHSVSAARRAEAARYLAGVLALALAYVAVAKGAQALHYTASVSAIWPPAGTGNRCPLPRRNPLVAGNLPRRAHHQRRAACLEQRAARRKPDRPAGRKHGRGHRRRSPVSQADRQARCARPDGSGGRDAARSRHGDRDQRDGRHRLDTRRGRDHTSEVPTFWRTWWLGDRPARSSPSRSWSPGRGLPRRPGANSQRGRGFAARGRDRPCRRLGLDQRGGDRTWSSRH